MSHSHKIHDDMPDPAEGGVQDAVQSQEFESSNSSVTDEESLRGQKSEEMPGSSVDTEEGQQESPAESGEEQGEAEKAEEGVPEAAEALRALQALESVLKDSAAEGRGSHEREIPCATSWSSTP